MSYNLVFWKQEGELDCAPHEIYTALLANELVDGLYELPGDDFLNDILDIFHDAYRDADNSVVWKGEDRGFQAIAGSQHVLIECQGPTDECLNVFIDIGRNYSCLLYDPQTNERFTE